MKTLTELWNKIFKGKVDCANDEHCPIYLSYLGKYGKDSEETYYCKNKNKQYCKKYRLIDETEWKKMNESEKMKVIIDMNLIEFIDKK